VNDKNEISLEFINYITFPEGKYSAFDIDCEGRAIIFYGMNSISLYQVSSRYTLNFIRKFPMYRFHMEMSFEIREETGQPIFQLLQDSLYILMGSLENPKDKRIFIYRITATSHNSLLNVIQLDENYTQYDLYLSTERISGFDSIVIYLFYNGRVYQYIQYQIENTIVPTFKNTTILVDPNDDDSFQTLDVPFKVFPIKTHWSQFMNDSHKVNILSQNTGLVVKQRNTGGVINVVQNDFPVTLSLLDYFEGFSLEYSLQSVVGGEDVSISLSGDNMDTYLLDAINATQRVLYSFQYM